MVQLTIMTACSGRGYPIPSSVEILVFPPKPTPPPRPSPPLPPATPPSHAHDTPDNPPCGQSAQRRGSLGRALRTGSTSRSYEGYNGRMKGPTSLIKPVITPSFTMVPQCVVASRLCHVVLHCTQVRARHTSGC